MLFLKLFGAGLFLVIIGFAIMIFVLPKVEEELEFRESQKGNQYNPKIIWKFQPTKIEQKGISISLRQPFSYSNKTLYLGETVTNDNSRESSDKLNFYALNTDNGTIKWAVDFPTRNTIASPPLIKDGNIYVIDNYDNLRVLNEATGEKKWEFILEKQNWNPRGQPNPILKEKTIYFGREYLYAVNTDTGKEIWRFKSDRPIQSLALEEEILYASNSLGDIFALEVNKGRQLWKFTPVVNQNQQYCWEYYNIYYSEDKIYFPRNCKTGLTFLVIDAVNGILIKEITPQPIKINDFSRAEPLIEKDNIYFPGEAGKLYSLNLKTGQVKWEFPPNSSTLLTNPDIVGGIHIIPDTVYLGTYEENVSCLFCDGEAYLHAVDKKTGTKKWSFRVDPDDGIYYITAGDGKVFASVGDTSIYGIE